MVLSLVAVWETGKWAESEVRAPSLTGGLRLAAFSSRGQI